MPAGRYRGRHAVTIENDHVRVTALEEGGHLAEILDKRSGVNPLWIPPWPSIEPSTWDAVRHPEYGHGTDAKLLAGIMGHNLCLDLFGGPSPEEAAAGLTAHGEAPVVPYEIRHGGQRIFARVLLPLARLRFERHVELRGRALRIREVVENLSAHDRPVGWTQHVTLGPPFLQKGATEFRASATRSKVFETDFGDSAYLKAAGEFEWPMAPRIDGGSADLRTFNDMATSSAFTAHLMDPDREHAFFVAFSPASSLAFGYVWRQRDFPWMGIWEENQSRKHSPWNGETLARGMEFGVSPLPETRREMIDRGTLFGVPTYRWIPAGSQVSVEYWAITQTADSIPESLQWPG